jgi:hypothetical protein
LWIDLFKEQSPRLPLIRFNKANCHSLIISMNNSRTKQGRNGEIKKDKSDETKKGVDQAKATHLSDALDVIGVGMWIHGIGTAQSIPEPRSI